MMDWKTAREKILYEDDGAFREVRILDTDMDVWERFIDLVNKKCKPIFTIGRGSKQPEIDKDAVMEYFSSDPEDILSSELYLDGFSLNIGFDTPDKIEMFFDPFPVDSAAKYKLLIETLTLIARGLEKEVSIYPEEEDEALLTISPE